MNTNEASENNSEVRKLAEEYRFQLFSVPSFISITRNISRVRSVISSKQRFFHSSSSAAFFNRSVNEIIQSPVWSEAIKQQIKEVKNNKTTVERHTTKKKSLSKKRFFKESSSSSSFVFTSHRFENELDFFFHLHFFDILTGKKNFPIPFCYRFTLRLGYGKIF